MELENPRETHQKLNSVKLKVVEISTRNHTSNSKSVKESEYSLETNKNSDMVKPQDVETSTRDHTSDNNRLAKESQDCVMTSTRNYINRKLAKKQQLGLETASSQSVTKEASSVNAETRPTHKPSIKKPRKRKNNYPKYNTRKTGKIIIYYTNADTLSNKMNLVIDEVGRIKPQIIGITEVKPKNYRYELQPTELNIPGYVLYENLSANGRGICIYVDEKLNVSETSINTHNSEECIWVEVKGKEDTSLTVGCVYRSPNSNEENNLNINKMIQNLNPTKRILMMGDFNYPEINWKDPDNVHAWDQKAEAFLESTRDAYLFQHVQEPTRHRTNQKRNPLDLIFTTDDSVDNVKLEAPLGNSDHCGIIFEVEMEGNQSEKQYKAHPNYNKADFSAIKSEIDKVDWKSLLTDKDINESWCLLNNTLKASCKRHVPMISQKDGKKRPMWMNQTALSKVKKKHHAWKRYLETKSGESYLEYTKARNQAKWETKKAKKAFEKMLAKNVKKILKSFGVM